MVMDDLISLINKLISYETVSTNLKEIESCFNFIANYLRESDYTVEQVLINNQPNLIIYNCKVVKYDMIFCGHIDVVSAEKLMFNPKIEGENLYGRGAIDMKSQIAIWLLFLKKYQGTKKIFTIITSDEEIGSKNGVETILNEMNLKARVALIPDGAYGMNLVQAGHGFIQMDFTFKGRETHVAYLNSKDNPIEQFVKFFRTFKMYIKLHDHHAKINIAKIESKNENYNIVPDLAIVKLDIRINKLKIAKLYKFLDLKNIDYKIVQYVGSFYNVRKAYIKKFNKILNSCMAKHIKPLSTYLLNEGRFFTDKGIPVICISPNGNGAHTENEFCQIESLYILQTAIEKFIDQI